MPVNRENFWGVLMPDHMRWENLWGMAMPSMNNLAGVLSRQGKYEQAEEMHRQVSRLSEKVLGKEHPDTIANMNNSAPGIDDSDVASICSIDWPNLD